MIGFVLLSTVMLMLSIHMYHVTKAPHWKYLIVANACACIINMIAGAI